VFLDLGFAPPSNAYLGQEDLDKPELHFPLKVYVCDHCWLVQTIDYAQADELFRPDYAYFSSTSSTWLKHAEAFTDMICDRLSLGHESMVVEVASNDGYLLKNFVARNIPCLGIEPASATARAAEALGVPVVKEFFGEQLAGDLVAQGRSADLIVANNVYAHVPDINDFTLGMKTLLKPGGTITVEIQHVQRLMERAQFDTIYHEHFSYHSLSSITNIFQRHGLRVFDVQELTTHGGSLRVYGCHEHDPRQAEPAVQKVMDGERQGGLHDVKTYRDFQAKADRIKDDLLLFLIEQKRLGKRVVGYGAAAKGNTLLNYAGVRPDLLPFVCDAAPSKQGKFLPGSHLPIVAPAAIRESRPDILLILPWNIAGEIMKQHTYIGEWGGRFAVAVPTLDIIGLERD